jgi:hypothetical protein
VRQPGVGFGAGVRVDDQHPASDGQDGSRFGSVSRMRSTGWLSGSPVGERHRGNHLRLVAVRLEERTTSPVSSPNQSGAALTGKPGGFSARTSTITPSRSAS